MNKNKNWMKPTNRLEFSSEDGCIDLPKDKLRLPSQHWKWQSGWYVEDLDKEDGWKYSSSFTGNFREKPFLFAFVRRRKWIRRRIFWSYNTYIEIDSPVGLEFVNDISVGGWLMPQQSLKGFLSVWIVTNNGRLFFRENVSYENPEGSNWKEIRLHDDLSAFSISCSQNGSLWVTTYEEKVLLRTGINPCEPWGNDWEILDPYPDAKFVQITSNLNYVYSLDFDSNVYFLDIHNEYKWIKILKDLSNISLSISNKLWALSNCKRKIFIGTRLHAIDDNFKFSWRSVQVPLLLDRLDSSIAFDHLEDLDVLKFS